MVVLKILEGILCAASESKLIPGSLPGGSDCKGFRRLESNASKSCSFPSAPLITISNKTFETEVFVLFVLYVLFVLFALVVLLTTTTSNSENKKSRKRFKSNSLIQSSRNKLTSSMNKMVSRGVWDNCAKLLPMPSPIKPDNNTNGSAKDGINNNLTLITSPLRRISSFIDEEESENDQFLTTATSPKRKRNPHSTQVQENEFTQLNRTQESQSKICISFACVAYYLCFVLGKRGIDQESSGSPLRKKSSKKQNDAVLTSWGARLKVFRSLVSEHCRNSNFEAWSREIWQLGSWWLEVAPDEAAGIINDLVDEFKMQQSRIKGFLVIPTICDNIFLDSLQAKCLVNDLNSSNVYIVLFLVVAG